MASSFSNGSRNGSPGPRNSPDSYRSFPMPDNRCCFCTTLRVGSIIVGFVNLFINLIGFTWYSTSPSIESSFTYSHSKVSDLDIFVCFVIVVQLIVDLNLIYGAFKKSPIHIVPWLCTNAIFSGVLMLLVAMLLFFGYVKLNLAYDEYVALLTLSGIITGAHLFSFLVVFQFRRNLIDARRISLRNMEAVERAETSSSRGKYQPCAPSPPPTYDEVSKAEKKLEIRIERKSESPPKYQDVLEAQKAEDDK